MIYNSLYTQDQPIRPHLEWSVRVETVQELQTLAYERWGQDDTQPYMDIDRLSTLTLVTLHSYRLHFQLLVALSATGCTISNIALIVPYLSLG